MEQGGNPADQAPQPGDLTAQAVAWWLLRPATPDDQGAEHVLAAAEDTYTLLRTRLAVSLGGQGFDALWLRACQRALLKTVGPDALTALPLLPPGTSGIRALGDPDDVPALYDRLHALLTSFFDLLVTFIGAQLTVRIVHELWPALTTGAADAPTKDDHHG